MIPVKSQQKYKCDFCKKRGIKRTIEFHELNCFRNPNRVCSYCKNKGYTIEVEVGPAGEYSAKKPCPYCAKLDKNMLAEIEKREQEEKFNKKEEKDNDWPTNSEPPF